MDEPQKPEQQQQGAGQPPVADRSQGKRRRSGAVAAAVAIGAVLLEPELLPGIAIGVAAAMFPKLFPRAAERLRPLGQSMRHTAEGVVAKGLALGKKAKEKIAHVSERVSRDAKTNQPA